MSKPWVSYVIAVGATLLAAFTRYSVDATFGSGPNILLPFFIAVIVSAWHGGLRTGIFATLLNGVVGGIFLSAAPLSVRAEISGIVRFGLFATIGVSISLLSETLHRYRREAEAATANAVQRQKALENEVFERRRAEATLLESNERYRLLTDALPHIVWTVLPGNKLEMVNARGFEFTGLSAEQVNAGSWGTLIHADDVPNVKAAIVGPIERGERHEFEYRLRHHTGKYRWVASCAVPIKNEAGAVIKWIGSTNDIHDRRLAEEQVRESITEKKQAEIELRELNATLEQRVEERTKALRDSEERFRSAFDNAPIGMALVTTDGKWLQVNRILCEIVGYTSQELLAKDFQSITHPDDLAADLKRVRQALDGTIQSFQIEKRYFHKQGKIIHILLSVTLVRDRDGKPLNFVSQVQDITQRKVAEERIRASLQEKEVMLREIHHRVKNNLQIVSTLLDLQSGYTQDQQALEMFKESRARVRSMALIHERLYRSHDLARVEFIHYVQQLADDLYHSYRLSGDEVMLEVDVDVPPLPIDVAIPCGLLINELMSNALKHAFNGARERRIHIGFHRNGDNFNVLTVADTGIGFPRNVDFRNTTSFGLQLVNTLVEQLQGKLDLKSERGTEFSVTFPNKSKTPLEPT